MFLHKSHIWENFCSWDMGQNVRSQSTILIDHISKTNQLFFACWYKFTWIKSWSKHFWVNMVKISHGESGHRTLKLTVFQEWIDGMNWYFARWCKSRKAKSYFNDFCVGMVRNGHGHLVHETLKSAVSKEWVYKFSWFFACWLWGSNFWLDWHHILYFWLLNASLLQFYLLNP